MRKIIFGLFIVIIIIGLIAGGIYLDRYKANDEVINFSDEIYLIIEDVLVEFGEPIILKDDTIYFSYDVIKTYFDENIFFDENEETLIITTDKYVKRYRIGNSEGSINSKKYLLDNPVEVFVDKVYVPLELIRDNYQLAVYFYPETNALVVDYTDIYYLKGEIIQEGASIRTDLDIKSPRLLADLEIGKKLYIYGEYENWYKVRTMDGIPGFIEKKYLKVHHTKDIYKSQLLDRKEDIRLSERINLTWDYTYRKLANADKVGPIDGVNVMSPTWFSITDADGRIYDKGNRDYVRKYGELGYDIWPLIDNSFDPDLTHDLLKTASKREKLINDILAIYLDYGFQGINIDFENIHLKDKDLLTQFVRELYPLFKENDLMVSMAVTTLSTSENWSLCYDRERLAETTDYLMLMAYDQHWAASPIAGSVAQYSWVENGIKGILELIPNEKLVLSVPYYTRLWIEEDGKMSSQALSMEVANRFIDENKIELAWDMDSMQYYGELAKDNKIYRIWLEDSNSLEYKASLINKYDLAGIASWRKGFETDDIWPTIAAIVN